MKNLVGLIAGAVGLVFSGSLAAMDRADPQEVGLSPLAGC